MRRLITFGSKGNRLVGTLDFPVDASTVGVLLVSGGNEIRVGAHRGQALLAADLARAGLPVFRFDRAGVGDSTGPNAGFAGSLPDIFNASLVLGNEAGVEAIVAVGNCDAATALARYGRRCGAHAVVLANPWLRDEPDTLPPAAAIRARYRDKLRRPAEWRRLLTGEIDLRKLTGGVAKLLRHRDPPPPATLDGIAAWGDDATVVLALNDATAIAFAQAAGARFRTVTIDTASHSFAGAAARTALADVILDRVRALRSAWAKPTQPPRPRPRTH